MSKHWSQKEISLLRKYYPKLWVKDLAKMFPNRTKATIVVKALSLELPSAKLWQPEENNILHKHFTESSMEELNKFLAKRSILAILAQGERLGLKRNRNKPRQNVNELYFKKWSPNMAYVLGFILADGGIIKGTYRGYSDALKFGVQIKDVDILRKIKQEFNSGHKISLVENAGYLTISSQKIVDDLKSLGITYRKSLKEKLPNIPSKYIKEFIRGIIDGDGSISFNKKGYPTLSVCGGKKVITFIRDHFLLKFNIYSKVGQRTKSKTKNSYLYSITYRGNPAKMLINYLYTDAGLYLERKFNLAKQCLLKEINYRKDYTEEENQIIRRFYRPLSKDKILSMLPTRSWSGIQQRAWRLNVYKYDVKK